jgi:hypothetical protein
LFVRHFSYRGGVVLSILVSSKLKSIRIFVLDHLVNPTPSSNECVNEHAMKPFILRGILNTNNTARLWSSAIAAPQPQQPTSGVLDVTRDPSVYINILWAQYSPALSDNVLAELQARAWEERSLPERKWWPKWIFENRSLQKLIGRRVILAESTTPPVFGANFVWVGIPCMTVKPHVNDIASTNREKFFSLHMVSLVTFNHPDAIHKFVWCTINCDGDTIPLDIDFLRVLLSTEIAELKTYVKRTGDRTILGDTMSSSSASGRDLFVNAAKLMTIRFDGIEPLAPTFVPVAIPPEDVPVPACFAPLAIPPVENRAKIMKTVHASIAKKRKAAGKIPNPFLADADNVVEQQRMRDFLAYFIHHGQFEPAVKDALAQSPHDGDVSKIMKDPAFVQYLQVMGNLFITENAPEE